MQTFLSATELKTCAENLDSLRLNKQRVEAFQLYNIGIGLRLDSITDEVIEKARGFLNHPAALMWKPYLHYLCMYGEYISNECDKRGIADNRKLGDFFRRRKNRHEFIVPLWWLNEETKNKIIHSHRANLLRKDFDYYSKIFQNISKEEAENTQYTWPTRKL